MKQLQILCTISLLCTSIVLFGQEGTRSEQIQRIRERVVACKILLKKAVTERNPTKVGELQAIINRLEERARQL